MMLVDKVIPGKRKAGQACLALFGFNRVSENRVPEFAHFVVY
jgi:hypothetical protein